MAAGRAGGWRWSGRAAHADLVDGALVAQAEQAAAAQRALADLDGLAKVT